MLTSMLTSTQRGFNAVSPKHATLVAVFGLLVASAHTMHGSTFTLATTGCSKKHCSQTEDDAVNLSTPAPASTGGPLSLYTPNSGPTPPSAT